MGFRISKLLTLPRFLVLWLCGGAHAGAALVEESGDTKLGFEGFQLLWLEVGLAHEGILDGMVVARVLI
jgi:hypothetical protein